MQERLISAAATTSMILRKGISETKDKMAVGKTKVEEVITIQFIDIKPSCFFSYPILLLVCYYIVCVHHSSAFYVPA